jgi:hypothetical protein
MFSTGAAGLCEMLAEKFRSYGGRAIGVRPKTGIPMSSPIPRVIGERHRKPDNLIQAGRHGQDQGSVHSPANEFIVTRVNSLSRGLNDC